MSTGKGVPWSSERDEECWTGEQVGEHGVFESHTERTAKEAAAAVRVGVVICRWCVFHIHARRLQCADGGFLVPGRVYLLS